MFSRKRSRSLNVCWGLDVGLRVVDSRLFIHPRYPVCFLRWWACRVCNPPKRFKHRSFRFHMKPFSGSVSDWIPRKHDSGGIRQSFRGHCCEPPELHRIVVHSWKLLLVGGGNPNIFGIFTPIFWGNKIPYLTCAYFSDMICWVETTNQTNRMKPQKLMGLEDESPFSTLGLIRLGFFFVPQLEVSASKNTRRTAWRSIAAKWHFFLIVWMHDWKPAVIRHVCNAHRFLKRNRLVIGLWFQ